MNGFARAVAGRTNRRKREACASGLKVVNAPLQSAQQLRMHLKTETGNLPVWQGF